MITSKASFKNQEDHRVFVLQSVQPALSGLMDGSVSTLAPIFAAAFATHSTHIAFLIGLSAATGAGISMAFAEALSDTGALTGRGHPFRRGSIVGAATFIGGIFHTVPFLIADLRLALALATAIVVVELITIAFIRYKYLHMNFWLSVLQVVLGGAIVFLAGIFIGSA
jgi:hypothetical protein